MNLEVLLDAADGDAGFARELADLYLANTAAQLALLHAALDKRSASTVQSIAHFCKGSSHTCGAARLASLFDEIERLARGRQLAQARRIAADVEDEFAHVQAALRVLPPPHAVPGPTT